MSSIEKWWFKQPPFTRGLVFGLLGGTIEFLFDGVAHLSESHWWEIHLYEDFATGVIYFLIGYWLARGHDKVVLKREKQLADLNHNTRNALQIIASAELIADPDARRLAVMTAVRRAIVAVSKITDDVEDPEDEP